MNIMRLLTISLSLFMATSAVAIEPTESAQKEVVNVEQNKISALENKIYVTAALIELAALVTLCVLPKTYPTPGATSYVIQHANLLPKSSLKNEIESLKSRRNVLIIKVIAYGIVALTSPITSFCLYRISQNITPKTS